MSEPQTDSTPEDWTYIGQRISSTGALCAAFLDGNGATLLFAKSRANSIGDIYRVDVVRTGDNVATRGEPRWLRQGNHNDPRYPSWVAGDAEAKVRKSARSAEKRSKERGGLGRLTLEQLRGELAKLPAPHRDGLLAVVLRYLR